jgi:hypothetical protein
MPTAGAILAFEAGQEELLPGRLANHDHAGAGVPRVAKRGDRSLRVGTEINSDESYPVISMAGASGASGRRPRR